MTDLLHHSWEIAPPEAVRVQKTLETHLALQPLSDAPETIAGADISTKWRGRFGVGGMVVFSWPDMELIDESFHSGELRFPYVPGLLSFREGLLLEKAFLGLRAKPDLIIFDGQGTAHPRGFGIASHLGLRLGVPSIGCAKSRLFGDVAEPVGEEKGDWRYLYSPGGRKIGAVLRTRRGVKPVYVSPGHLIDIEDSVHWVLAATSRFRLPEVIRAAHRRVGEERARRKKA
ncbi:MAG: endonuclease V [Nitrospinae bacterium]|nr:endonuclease V [Nitrospinota bacterium]